MAAAVMTRSAYAPFGLRLLAAVVDIAVLSALGGIVFGLTGLPGAWIPEQVFPSFNSYSSLIAVVLYWLYMIGLTKTCGATLGKMAFGLQVVSDDEETLDWVTVIIRETIGKMISLLPLGLGFWWVSWDAKKQAFHDKIAKTLVVCA